MNRVRCLALHPAPGFRAAGSAARHSNSYVRGRRERGRGEVRLLNPSDPLARWRAGSLARSVCERGFFLTCACASVRACSDKDLCVTVVVGCGVWCVFLCVSGSTKPSPANPALGEAKVLM